MPSAKTVWRVGSDVAPHAIRTFAATGRYGGRGVALEIRVDPREIIANLFCRGLGIAVQALDRDAVAMPVRGRRIILAHRLIGRGRELYRTRSQCSLLGNDLVQRGLLRREPFVSSLHGNPLALRVRLRAG